MKDNPFSPSFGNKPSRLIGREDVVARFLEGLNSKPGSRDRAMLLLGQRGQGKTVLLLELAERALSCDYVVASPTIVASGMLDRIVEKVQEAGAPFQKKKRGKITGGNIGAFGFSAGLQFSKEDQESKSFSYKISHLCRALEQNGKGVLILVDEIKASNADLKQLIIAYQEMVGEGRNIAMVLAGLPGAVSSTLNDKVLTFLNRAAKVELGPLRIAEIDAYYVQAFREAGLSIPADMRKRAAEMTQGSPYLMQLTGYYITLYANEKGSIAKNVFEDALKQARNEYIRDVCETALHAMSKRDISFLQAMAGKEKEQPASGMISEIAARMGVTGDYAQQYRRRLCDAGIIEVTGHGEVGFAVPYLETYLRGH